MGIDYSNTRDTDALETSAATATGERGITRPPIFRRGAPATLLGLTALRGSAAHERRTMTDEYHPPRLVRERAGLDGRLRYRRTGTRTTRRTTADLTTVTADLSAFVRERGGQRVPAEVS